MAGWAVASVAWCGSSQLGSVECNVTIRFHIISHTNQLSSSLIGPSQTSEASDWSDTNTDALPLVAGNSWDQTALLLVDYYYVLTESTERGRNFLESRLGERQQRISL